MSVTVGFSYDRHIQGRVNSIDIFNGINNAIEGFVGNGNGFGINGIGNVNLNQISNTINVLNSGIDLAQRFINI